MESQVVFFFSLNSFRGLYASLTDNRGGLIIFSCLLRAFLLEGYLLHIFLILLSLVDFCIKSHMSAQPRASAPTSSCNDSLDV